MSMRIHVARSFLQRARGLLGRSAIDADEALLIHPCASIHTFGMRFAIDVVFIDPRGRVLALHEALRPWRVARCRGAAAVLELAPGAARRAGLLPGASAQAATGMPDRDAP
jgi:hypothetical protein